MPLKLGGSSPGMRVRASTTRNSTGSHMRRFSFTAVDDSANVPDDKCCARFGGLRGVKGRSFFDVIRAGFLRPGSRAGVGV